MNLIFRCLTVLLTLIGNEAVFAFSGIGNTLDFGELAAFLKCYKSIPPCTPHNKVS